MSVSGGASMNITGHTGEGRDAGTSFSMGNQLTFSGSGELDNGLNVSLSFVLDQGDDTATAIGSGTSTVGTGSPFDSHSVSISSDSLGTLKFAGEGGANVQTGIDTTAAGDLWDNGFGITAAQDPKGSASGNNMMSYTLPTIMDGVALSASYMPKGTGAESSSAYAIAYTGVEGLTLNYASGSDDSTAGSESDTTTMKASYAYGPITVSYSENEFDGAGTGANTDQEVTGYEVAYTVSDAISISYGAEDIKTPDNASDQDMDISGIVASYTAGGMTITGTMISADNTAHGTADTQDKDEWSIAASFAF
jgi:outer membrane protein OmpU